MHTTTNKRLHEFVGHFASSPHRTGDAILGDNHILVQETGR
jgi:hypothetical protein